MIFHVILTKQILQVIKLKDVENVHRSDDSLSNFDWNGLATSLLSYKESQMCRQSYITGSGNIMQSEVS